MVHKELDGRGLLEGHARALRVLAVVSGMSIVAMTAFADDPPRPSGQALEPLPTQAPVTPSTASATREAELCDAFSRHPGWRPPEESSTGPTGTLTAQQLEECAYALVRHVQYAWTNVEKHDDQFDVEARYLYERYKDLRAQADKLPNATPAEVNGAKQAKAAVELLGSGNGGRRGPTRLQGVRDLMGERGLRTGLSALFVAGYLRPSLASSSPEPAQAAAAAATDEADSLEGADNASTPVTGHIVWSTRHWRLRDSDTLEEHRFSPDVSLTGRVGLQPALSLVKPASGVLPEAEGAVTGGGEGESQERAVIQDAFIWDLGPRLHLHIGDNWEIEALGRVGQTYLISDIVTLTSGNEAQVFVPLGGPGSAGAEWFYEMGATVRFTLQSLDLLHEQNGLVEPAFEVGFSRRRDSRLESTTENQVVFADRWSRKAFRFSINGVPVKNVPGQKDNAKLFTLSFAVEHQWGGSIPAATAFSIRGNVNLVKALKGSGG